MPISIPERVMAALAATSATPDLKKDFGKALLDAAGKHAEAYGRRFNLMVTVGTVWTMLALGSVELKDVGGMRILNLMVVDLVGLPITAYLYYQSMLSAMLLDSIETARRAFYHSVWQELREHMLDELLVAPDPVSEDSAIGNLEIDNKTIRELADIWTGLFGTLLYISPLLFFAWASYALIARSPISAMATYFSVIVTILFAIRGGLLFAQVNRS